ncbi:hypothetical protein Taro_035761 [Colocasia esculenta]|uniref:Uncharacterized protein n=1 Tax=Colocasia esculenta TaxID=4460 RepID=A0A843W194_COLES|nr:hypothetical protein [Colocasia esculenta]
MVGVSTCNLGQGVPLGPSGGNAAGCLPAFTDQRVVLFRFVGVPATLAGKGLLFEFIAYVTGLNSNPSGSSDTWVAARPSGVPRGSGRSGCYSCIRAQGSNEICNELITMAVLKKGTRALLARPCRVAFRDSLSQEFVAGRSWWRLLHRALPAV